MTVVHHPEDARVLHREIRALADAGHEVIFAAPFSARGVVPRPWVTGVDLPRAEERRRFRAVREARKVFRELRDRVDIVVVHDPELLLAVLGIKDRPPVVWDVHEDTPATLSLKPWLPRWLRPPVRVLVRAAEKAAEKRVHLILAETAYAHRFAREHLIVPNNTWVPETVSPPGDDRVVYLGWLSHARGVREAIEVARLLRPHRVAVELIGYADAQSRPLLTQAVEEGVLEWRDFMPNDEALKRLDGALAGLSLLHDQPNYRHSLPTKVIEYMAHGIPVITTPSPRAVELVERYGSGVVVPWQDPQAVAQAVLRLRDDAEERRARGRRGHTSALRFHHWPNAARDFVAQLEVWAEKS
ncbi:glycosyltransferase [Bailinhaonella thermotolerans]|uniref:Glycosyltransferase n=2 Tax=Bailinhaonella thermotolerans TaxID=1070861 RepID=A0A3A4B2P6_9ACTN|nr:glycosyltransferase [Bailinhaonella thermotolerans]